MNKKIKKFLYLDWRKAAVFLSVILFFSFLWIQILVNSLPVMIIGTQDFENTFCNIKLNAENCSISSSQLYQNEASLNQTVDQLNSKYNKFYNLNSNFDLAKTFIPTSAMSCILNKDVVSLINQSTQIYNTDILGMTSMCSPSGLLYLAANLIIVYLVICCFFWLYDKKK
jgi:hypothetical protein